MQSVAKHLARFVFYFLNLRQIASGKPTIRLYLPSNLSAYYLDQMEEWETPLYHMIQTVDVGKEPWEQLENLKKFDNLPQEQLDELVSGPYNKEEGAAIVMQYLPIERFAGKFRILLSYTMDYNWPAAYRMGNWLSAIGEPILPEIKRVFREDKNDTIWLSNTIRGIVARWDNLLIFQLKKELLEIAKYADVESASISALKVLQRIMLPDEFEKCYRYLEEKYAADANLTEELKDAFDI